MTTLNMFLQDPRQLPPAEGAPLAQLLLALAEGCAALAQTVALGALVDALGEAGSTNVQGEAQKKLDVIAHDAMVRAAAAAGCVAALASEEAERLIPVPAGAADGRYLLMIDPLDGSSNIDCNVTVGTIFSVLRRHRAGAVTAADCMQRGRDQVAAGYVLYGPSTLLVLTLGRGTHGFTLDRRSGTFRLTHPSLRIPEQTAEYAINHANRRYWEPPVARYVQALEAGATGPLGKDFNTRWVASMIVDVHRILTRGGVYLYPRDARYQNGRLRLLYEANPAAFLIEQAGGKASTGRCPILDVLPEGLHEKVALIHGAAAEVDRIVRYHDEHDQGIADDYTSPLFRERRLFAA